MYQVIGAVRTRTFRVLWALEELGQPYESRPEPPRSDAVQALNPLGKIPVLKDGDAVLTDSVAIMTYLADKHGALTAPAGTPERAQQDAITHWLMDEFDAVLWAAAKHRFVLPEALRVPELQASLIEEFARSLDTLESMITGDFLMGDTITVPDILAVHCINWAIGVKFRVENEAVNAYAKRLRARDAFRKVRALDAA